MQDCSQTDTEKIEMLTVQVFGFRVLYIDCNHFPISLSLIDHGKDPEHLNFDHFATGTHLERTFQFAVHFLLSKLSFFPITFMYTQQIMTLMITVTS